MQTTKRSKRFLEILQNILCNRLADESAELAEIDRAFELGELSSDERGALSRYARASRVNNTDNSED